MKFFQSLAFLIFIQRCLRGTITWKLIDFYSHTQLVCDMIQSLCEYLRTYSSLRWPEPIYMRVGYVFDLRFSEGKIQPISMIFGIPKN